METNTKQETMSNVIDMQFYRLRRAISQVRNPLEFVTLAELALAYVDGAVTIEMCDGKMIFKSVAGLDTLHEGIV